MKGRARSLGRALATGLMFVACAVLSRLDALGGKDLDEFKVKREAVFEFARKPVVTRAGDRITIEFETKGFCDVTVAGGGSGDRMQGFGTEASSRTSPRHRNRAAGVRPPILSPERSSAIWRRAAELMLTGDCYPLTPIHRTPEKCVARQFDCPAIGQGFIQDIRLPVCAEETLAVHPKAMRPDAVYLFENPETGDTRELAEEPLRKDGFTFALPERQGAIWFYRVK